MTNRAADTQTKTCHPELVSGSMQRTFMNTKHHEITFQTKDGITISGTLSIPEKSQNPPVVILITGTGPYDRDSTAMNGTKLFVDVADYFTNHGIAVLRFDKRGTGKSGGVYKNSSLIDFAYDVQAAVDYAKHEQSQSVDSHKIGLVGHSWGATIAFYVASKSPDVAFVVSMAGGVITNIDDIVDQTKLFFKASGATDEFIAHDSVVRHQLLETVITQPADQLEKSLTTQIKEYLETQTADEKELASKLFPLGLAEENYQHLIPMFTTEWRQYLLSNPEDFIHKVHVPVLAINGDLDFIMYDKIALPIIKRELDKADNENVTIVSLPNQNHCFQECQTGALQEYFTTKETIAQSTLKLMTDWIAETTN